MFPVKKPKEGSKAEEKTESKKFEKKEDAGKKKKPFPFAAKKR